MARSRIVRILRDPRPRQISPDLEPVPRQYVLKQELPFQPGPKIMKIMLKQGYNPDFGLGKFSQGRVAPVKVTGFLPRVRFQRPPIKVKPICFLRQGHIPGHRVPARYGIFSTTHPKPLMSINPDKIYVPRIRSRPMTHGSTKFN